MLLLIIISLYLKVTVHYGGFLMDGTKFDSSFDRRKPFTFELGVGQVIPGWDEGLQGVCAGDERHLVVPSHLAYGERGAGDVIPPGATLLFDVVVVDVKQVRFDILLLGAAHVVRFVILVVHLQYFKYTIASHKHFCIL